jgi:hypothetical protein
MSQTQREMRILGSICPHLLPQHTRDQDSSENLQEAREHGGVPRYLVTRSIPPRIYASHISLVSSIWELSSCLEEKRCDALVEDDVWVNFNTTTDTYLQVVGLELQKESTSIGENTFLIKREC